MKHLVALGISIAALLYAPGAAGAPEAAARAETAFLTQSEAAARSQRVSNVAYELAFELTGAPQFSGTSTIHFDLNDAATALTIDLNQARITRMLVNGKRVEARYNNWFVTLAPQDLIKGRNSVQIDYTRAHSTNGEGLHRMQDPVDGKVYTYSHFEPAAAQQMFALFDQPDLKATFEMSVTVPPDWHVISTRRESAVHEHGTQRRWIFPKTKKLSPYNFSLHAGPYKVWEDLSGKYPMRLFARQSLATQVVPADWFKFTKAGLVFFDDYFGIAYPFEKYDQILVPDFLYGAMENAAAVTFAEARFLHGSGMTDEKRQRLAGVIMHEMAHQWFGDLVTMKWWNGLWLNESFASFMGTLAMAEATEFQHAWQSFYLGAKQGAYSQDQGPATHPIETPVPSSANAFDNIDAITYSKGASALKQLRHLLGDEVFRKGVHNYLLKYQYRNATLDDFIGSLAGAAKRDLGGWTEQWLYQAGVNTIEAEYACTGDKVSRFALRQSAPSQELPTLREQKVRVATFVHDGGMLTLSQDVAVAYKGASTPVPELVGSACPALVYPNYQDWGYAMVRLDQGSFATASRILDKVADPLLRAMLWQSLWDGVRAAHFPLNAFIDTALQNALAEKDRPLLGAILDKVAHAHDYLARMQLDPAYARRTGAALEDMAWRGVSASAGEPNLVRSWFGAYLKASGSEAALARLTAILDGKTVIDSLTLDQDLRWAIIARLNQHDYRGSAALIAAEQQRDRSDSGQAAALRASVVRPDTAVKAQWLATVEDLKTSHPFSRIRTAMHSLYPDSQGALSEQSAAGRLERLAALDQTAGAVYMRAYAGSLIPANCTPASVARLARALEQNPTLSAGTRRALLSAHREDQRCVAIKAALTLP